jgi:small subunit ribosomal protein S14
MATTAKIEKSKRDQKFAVRNRNRCKLCGRPRGYIRIFKMCRMCFRKHALSGSLPGVKKTSW